MSGEQRITTLSVRADEAVVSSRDVTSLGLIVAELVMNAFKYAFPDSREGSVDVAYDVGPDGWALSVTDNGVGRLPAEPGHRVGLGTGVVRALARQLGATVELASAEPGLRVTLAQTPAPDAGAGDTLG